MARFVEKTLAGVTYDLSHLDPMRLAVTFEGRTFQTLVNFSCHCFTEKFDDQKHSADDEYRFGGERRAFCIDRHQLSLALPQHFVELGNKTVYHTQKESFFFIRTVTDLGVAVPYVVFFRSYKSNQDDLDVLINVSSAYPKPGMTSWASPVKFPRVVNARARGLQLPLGKPQKIKRA